MVFARPLRLARLLSLSWLASSGCTPLPAEVVIETDASTSATSTGPDPSTSTEPADPSTSTTEPGTLDTSSSDTGAVPACGNGTVEAPEDCDGTDLAGASCEDLGLGDGTLACDDRCAYDTSGCTVPPAAPVLALGFSPVKRFDFTWAAVPGAEFYRLLESPAPGEPFGPLGGDIVGESISIPMPLYLRYQASYALQACNAAGCADSAVVDVMGSLAEAVGYFKASIPGVGEELGFSVALSGDGNTLAVGAPSERSSATGIDGNEADESTYDAGAVYVFVRDAATNQWSQQAYVKASNTGAADGFGWSVALSHDGSTLAVGANGEASNAPGVGGNEADDSAYGAGAVYVFVRDAATNQWSQQAYVKASNPGGGDAFGISVALAGDGDTLAVGAYHEDGSSAGIDGPPNDSAYDAGAVYVLVRDAVTDEWSQQAYVKASNPDNGDEIGFSVALSFDGDTLAVGALGEASNASGVGGNQADDSLGNAGAVYVLVRDAATDEWSQQAYVKASNPDGGDRFGLDVALAGDGNTLAVAAPYESSSAAGIGGNEADDSLYGAGAVYVLVRDGVTDEWSQQAYVKASNPGLGDGFGTSVALSFSGDELAVGADDEDGSTTGLQGDRADDAATGSGAAYVLVRSGAGTWTQQAYVKAPNTGLGDAFGGSVAISGEAGTLAVGAIGESSSASGIGGDQRSNAAYAAGAVYLY